MRIFILTILTSISLLAESSKEILSGVNQRIDVLFKADAGNKLKRAKKLPPLKPGRGNYTRAYSYSIVGYAARCFYLNEMIKEANAALVENAQHYLDNPKDILDRDSFHWHAEIVMRLIEEYGPSGSKVKGLLSKQTRDIVLKPIWLYVKKVSNKEKYETNKSKTWHIYESENHHAMSITTCWHFSKLASSLTQFKSAKYDDGATAQVHFEGWNKCFIRYCLERARKGCFVEMMSDDYNTTLIKGIYNFYDFGNANVRKAAQNLLDLYLTYWAQEQINGVQGGGKSRIYFFKGMRQNRNTSAAALAWIYFKIGKISHLHGHDVGAALSQYRPPEVIVEIARNHVGRGKYEVHQRPLGLATEQGMHPYKMNTEKGGIIRYSYCTPSFILGTTMVEAKSEKSWAKISSQNRWQGVIFNDANDARIIPIVRPKDNRVAFNGQWSVQSKGTLITQKLKTSKGAAEMIVWLSKAGLTEPKIDNSFVFVEAKEAYAAIRVVKNSLKLTEEIWQYNNRKSPAGNTVILKDQFSPLILEVMQKSEIESFDEFQKKVKACRISVDKNFIEYQSIYNDSLKFFFDYSQLPSINGKPIQIYKGKALDSPFLKADWNTGIVTIQKGKLKKILDFNPE